MAKKPPPKIKNQHFVSSFYLKAFAHNKNQLHIFDKTDDRCFINNINTSATIRYFYDIPDEWLKDKTADVQTVEKTFSVLEGYYQPAHSKAINLVAGEMLDLDSAFILGHMLTSQFLRTRAARRAAHENHKNYMKEFIGDLYERNFAQDHGDKFKPKLVIDDRSTGLLLAQMIFDGPAMHEKVMALFRKHWTFWISRGAELFLTSDHPVSMAVTSKRAYTYGVAPASPFGVEVAFPLSPRCLLTVGDPPPIPSASRMTFYADSERVRIFNQMQVVSSCRYLFGQSDGFELAKQMCKEMPSLREEAKNENRIISLREESKSTVFSYSIPRHLALY